MLRCCGDDVAFATSEQGSVSAFDAKKLKHSRNGDLRSLFWEVHNLAAMVVLFLVQSSIIALVAPLTLRIAARAHLLARTP